jgi:putative membrane protein
MTASEGEGADEAPTQPGEGAAGAAAGGAAEVPWRALHPLSLVVNLLPTAWRTVRGAWPLLLALVVGQQQRGQDAADLSLLTLFFGMTLFRTLSHFLTLRYRVAGGRLEVTSGLLLRQSRVVDPARIQNLSLERNLFHRLAGLVELRVETAGDASSNGLLSALSVEEAERLQAELRALVSASRGAAGAEAGAGGAAAGADGPSPVGEDGPVTPLVRAGPLELLAYGFTQRTVGTVAVLTAVALELLGRMGPEGAAQVRFAARPAVLGAALVLAFGASWFWSAGNALLRHWGFVLEAVGGRLRTREGLFTTRTVEIPLAKVQTALVALPWLRRSMGFGSVLVETAALGFGEGPARPAEGVVPMVPVAELPRVVGVAIPEAQGVDLAGPWVPAAPLALLRAVVGRALRYAAVLGVLGFIARPEGFYALLAVPLAVPVAALDWRAHGYRLTAGLVMVRAGFFRRSILLMPRRRIQSVHLTQSAVDRWAGLAWVTVRGAGADITFPALKLDEAMQLYGELVAGLPRAAPLPGAR